LANVGVCPGSSASLSGAMASLSLAWLKLSKALLL
jgi:hypothetical protein